MDLVKRKQAGAPVLSPFSLSVVPVGLDSLPPSVNAIKSLLASLPLYPAD